jgi:hypothetical protein
MIITGIGVTHWEIQLANVEPFAIHFRFLEPIEGSLSHSPTVTVGVSARTNDEIVRHIG